MTGLLLDITTFDTSVVWKELIILPFASFFLSLLPELTPKENNSCRRKKENFVHSQSGFDQQLILRYTTRVNMDKMKRNKT